MCVSLCVCPLLSFTVLSYLCLYIHFSLKLLSCLNLYLSPILFFPLQTKTNWLLSKNAAALLAALLARTPNAFLPKNANPKRMIQNAHASLHASLKLKSQNPPQDSLNPKNSLKTRNSLEKLDCEKLAHKIQVRTVNYRFWKSEREISRFHYAGISTLLKYTIIFD